MNETQLIEIGDSIAIKSLVAKQVASINRGFLMLRVDMMTINCTGSPYGRSAAGWPTSDKTANAKVTVVGLDNGSYSVIYSNHRIKHYNEYTSLDLQLVRCE